VVQTKYINPGNKRNLWSKEWLEWYNVLHEEVHQDQLSIHGQIFVTEFKSRCWKKLARQPAEKRRQFQR
jgi:hypothetical protein